MFFVVNELIDNPEKPIVDIALEYGYSEQSSLNRDMKKHYAMTPKQVRINKCYVKDEKLTFKDFDVNHCEWGKRLKYAIEISTGSELLVSDDLDYFDTFVEATTEYGFDIATCCVISELSERLGIPFSVMVNNCFEMMVDVRSSSDYLELKMEKAIDCGISSYEELDKICEYYECEYYQINRFMVEQYRKSFIKIAFSY